MLYEIVQLEITLTGRCSPLFRGETAFEGKQIEVQAPVTKIQVLHVEQKQ